MFGPPGAGKGTQSENLVKKFNLYKISTGDLLREEIKKKSSLGNKIKIIMDQGQLVSDDIINNLIEGLISNKEYHNRCIFDGYPRTLNQAKNLDNLIHKHNQKISLVLSLDVDEETIIKRILGRQTCSKCGLIFNEFFKPATKNNDLCDSKFLQKRSDDTKETLSNRFKTYIKETLPILNYYRKQGLLSEIGGKGNIHQIYKEIHQIIDSLHT